MAETETEQVDPPVYDERGNVRPKGTPGAVPMTYAERVEIARRLAAGEEIVAATEQPDQAEEPEQPEEPAEPVSPEVSTPVQTPDQPADSARSTAGRATTETKGKK